MPAGPPSSSSILSPAKALAVGAGTDEVLRRRAGPCRRTWAARAQPHPRRGARCQGGLVGDGGGARMRWPRRGDRRIVGRSPRRSDFTATRRLAVAAERFGVGCWLIRLQGAANLSSGARERWRLASAPERGAPLRSPRPPVRRAGAAELFRSRRRLPATWLGQLEGTGDNSPDLLPLAAQPGDRALGQRQRRA